MVTKSEAKEIIVSNIVNDARIPDTVDTITREPDMGGADAQKTVPLLLLAFDDTSRATHLNSDFVGYKTDDDGNKVARVFQSQWETTARIEMWTADRSTHPSIEDLGPTLREVLYTFDSRSRGDPFLDDAGDPVDDIWNFSLQSGGRDDDLTTSPTIRRWVEQATVSGVRYFVEDELPPVTSTDETVTET